MRVLGVEIRHVDADGTVDDALPFQANGAIQARHARSRVTHVDIERIAGRAVADRACPAGLGKGIELAVAELELLIGLDAICSSVSAVDALPRCRIRTGAGWTP